MRLTLLATGIISTLTLNASGFTSVLSEIERNNLELKALRGENIAAITELKSGNNILGSSDIEFSPFFTKGVSGMASYELIVSQEIEFPTLLHERNRSSKALSDVVEKKYAIERRETLFSAKTQLINLVYLTKQQSLLDARLKNSRELLDFYKKKYDRGDATIIELNNLKMDMMELNTEIAQNLGAIDETKAAIKALNGGIIPAIDSLDYPKLNPLPSLEALKNELMAEDMTFQLADANVTASQQELRISKRSWLPSITVGYRRNGDKYEPAINGMLIGLSFNLFGNGTKTKAVRQQLNAAELSREAARAKAESDIETAYQKIKTMYRTLESYDMNLMSETLQLMGKAVGSGRMSLPDFCVEANGIYTRMANYITLQNELQLIEANLYKNRL